MNHGFQIWVRNCGRETKKWEILSSFGSECMQFNSINFWFVIKTFVLRSVVEGARRTIKIFIKCIRHGHLVFSRYIPYHWIAAHQKCIFSFYDFLLPLWWYKCNAHYYCFHHKCMNMYQTWGKKICFKWLQITGEIHFNEMHCGTYP